MADETKDPLRAEIERLAKEWDQMADWLRANGGGGTGAYARNLQAREHASALRAALAANPEAPPSPPAESAPARCPNGDSRCQCQAPMDTAPAAPEVDLGEIEGIMWALRQAVARDVTAWQREHRIQHDADIAHAALLAAVRSLVKRTDTRAREEGRRQGLLDAAEILIGCWDDGDQGPPRSEIEQYAEIVLLRSRASALPGDATGASGEGPRCPKEGPGCTGGVCETCGLWHCMSHLRDGARFTSELAACPGVAPGRGRRGEGRRKMTLHTEVLRLAMSCEAEAAANGNDVLHRVATRLADILAHHPEAAPGTDRADAEFDALVTAYGLFEREFGSDPTEERNQTRTVSRTKLMAWGRAALARLSPGDRYEEGRPPDRYEEGLRAAAGWFRENVGRLDTGGADEAADDMLRALSGSATGAPRDEATGVAAGVALSPEIREILRDAAKGMTGAMVRERAAAAIVQRGLCPRCAGTKMEPLDTGPGGPAAWGTCQECDCPNHVPGAPRSEEGEGERTKTP